MFFPSSAKESIIKRRNLLLILNSSPLFRRDFYTQKSNQEVNKIDSLVKIAETVQV